jgi:predicted regulator of Ras-like GTPase activity (Roadblock/LC7/MglB family)
MAQAADALAHLTEISSQIEAAVVLDREGTVLASTVEDDRAGRMAAAALELFRAAEERSDQELVQLDAALEGGSVFVVRDEERLIAAATRAEPTVGLVFYDLTSALRGLADQPKRAPAKRRTASRAKKDDEGA